MTQNDSKFDLAIARFDEANSEDPNKVMVDGEAQAKELVYARRLTEWVRRLAPDASEALLLAARSQHIRRWTIPRDRYPMDRQGYHQWRTTLYKFHADTAGDVLRETGFDQAVIDGVRTLLLKEGLKTNPEMQTLEDAICLTFLQYEFSDFVRTKAPEKIPRIIRRTWNKMSEKAQQIALSLDLSGEDRKMIEEALKE